MSNGLLKKRIIKEYNMKDGDSTEVDSGMFLSFRGVWKLIDSAKKDMLKNSYRTNSGYIGIFYDDWKKWFGDV